MQNKIESPAEIFSLQGFLECCVMEVFFTRVNASRVIHHAWLLIYSFFNLLYFEEREITSIHILEIT